MRGASSAPATHEHGFGRTAISLVRRPEAEYRRSKNGVARACGPGSCACAYADFGVAAAFVVTNALGAASVRRAVQAQNSLSQDTSES